MARGPQNAPRGKDAPSTTQSAEPASIDLGIALSVYGKTPQGRLVELNEAGAAPDDLTTFDTWPTEQ